MVIVMKKKINIKEISTYISSLGIIITFVVTVIGYCSGLFVKQSEIKQSLETSLRMSLKSIIWNKEVPLVERTIACDEYISLGYNSYTKKHCENLLRGVEE